jgi:hypothetical protein
MVLGQAGPRRGGRFRIRGVLGGRGGIDQGLRTTKRIIRKLIVHLESYLSININNLTKRKFTAES